jgi:signal transduction histidine kinase
VVTRTDGTADDSGRPLDALHDSVIQRLFATGLQLESALGRISDATARQRVRHSVDVLDEIIGEVRSALHNCPTQRDVPTDPGGDRPRSAR